MTDPSEISFRFAWEAHGVAQTNTYSMNRVQEELSQVDSTVQCAKQPRL